MADRAQPVADRAQRAPRVLEREIQHGVLKALGAREELRIWRHNVGFARDATGRGIRFGLPGAADLQGIIRGRDPSRPLGRFLAIELKTPTGRQSPEQRAFQRMVEAMGGVYLLCRSVDDAVAGVARALADPVTIAASGHRPPKDPA